MKAGDNFRTKYTGLKVLTVDSFWVDKEKFATLIEAEQEAERLEKFVLVKNKEYEGFCRAEYCRKV